jgi:hypothetical protein
VVVGVLGVLALPVGVFLSWLSTSVELLYAAFAIPVALGLGVLALALARRARSQVRALRRGGHTQAALGRALGLLAICLGITASISVGFYGVLVLFQ